MYGGSDGGGERGLKEADTVAPIAIAAVTLKMLAVTAHTIYGLMVASGEACGNVGAQRNDTSEDD